MRVLHTSDWHVGRSFHQHSTLDALNGVFDAVAGAVTDNRVDVVVASGDIYDSSTPSADSVDVFNSILRRLRDAGAQIVLIAGNHDSAARLGTMSAFAASAGVHVITRHDRITDPVTITDEHGPVHFYGIPFLEPARLRSTWTDVPMRTQKDAVNHAMDLVRSDLRRRGGRSVVSAHTFAQGSESESCESERDIVSTAAGGVDKVPVSSFDGVTYAALGHIHGSAVLDAHVRYSGAPLLYSFSEAGKPRGGWLVDLDAGGLGDVDWVGFPVPREAVTLKGRIDELLGDVEHEHFTGHWVRAVLTDDTRPVDPMRRLQARFPHCVDLIHQPETVHDDGAGSYATLVRGRSDPEIIDAFLARVRNGEATTAPEAPIIDEVLASHREMVTR